MEVEQAIRESHCAKKLSGEAFDHKCAGICTITPDGIELKCPLCGDGSEYGHLQDLRCFDSKEYAIAARQILNTAGIDWDSLSTDTQLRVVREIKKLKKSINKE